MRAGTVALLFVLAPFAAPASGQTKSPAPTYLALEVYVVPNEPPAYIAVPSSGSSPAGMWTVRFRKVAGWTTPAGELPVRAVNFRTALAGEAVRVWISVYLGRFESERLVTTLTLGEGEKVKVSDLSKFGVEPIDVAVVRISPSVAESASIKSLAPSIQALAVQPNVSTLPSRRILLRNTSHKDVSALFIRVWRDGKVDGTRMPQGDEGQALIPAGAVYEIDHPASLAAVTTPEGYQPRGSAGQTIEIATAVFSDGSFEGDMQPAMVFRGFVKGRERQLARVVEILQAALERDSSDPVATIDSLRRSIASLSISTDPETIDELFREFPSLPTRSKQLLRSPIETAMTGIRRDVLQDIGMFQASNSVDRSSLRRWLLESKTRYEAWARRL